MQTNLPLRSRPALLASVAVAALALGIALVSGPSVAESARLAPPPAVDEPAAASGSETAVLAGGCFWGVQGVFQHVRGVTSAVSGYAGGPASNAHYEEVGRGNTGHAESVRITFDPRQVSYGRLLQIYMSVAHDPTELNRQGPDTGPQYRSAIFPTSAEQARVATAYIAQLDAARTFGKKLATTVETAKPFFPAEDYHQDFLARNPGHPYIVYNDLPKIEQLKRLFPDSYAAKPVLVSAAKP